MNNLSSVPARGKENNSIPVVVTIGDYVRVNGFTVLPDRSSWSKQPLKKQEGRLIVSHLDHTDEIVLEPDNIVAICSETDRRNETRDTGIPEDPYIIIATKAK